MNQDEAAGDSAENIPLPEKVRPRNWVPLLVWLIPILAAAVGVWLAVHTWIQKGPEITITFRSGEGLEAGKTKVRYKEVEIGTVKSIMLSEDHTHVLVTVQLQKEAKGFTATDSRFWVVRPLISISRISALSTLLFGSYIGADAGIEAEKKDKFTGLEAPPLFTRDVSGKQYVLHATDLGSLEIGSPVYYRRIKVGQVTAFDLDDEGKGITTRIFINAPYDKLVGVNTRFWHASGFSIQGSAEGFKLQTESLAAIVAGGLALQSPDDNPGPPATEHTAFALAENQAEALKMPDGDAVIILLIFKQSLRGLVPGAEVSFRGLVLGQVKSVGVEYDRERHEFNMPVLVQIYPERLGRRYSEYRKDPRYTAHQRLQFMIDRGLRAQLRSPNILTGQRYVAFDFFPEVAATKRDASKSKAHVDDAPALLELPTIPSTEEIQAQVSEIARKLNKIPFDQIGSELHQSLKKLKGTLNSATLLADKLNNDVAPEMIVALKDAQETLNAAGRILSEDAPLQQDLRQTLQELSRTAISLRVLMDYLERHPESVIRGRQGDKQ
jgi:paraquat-inducible protein B